MGKFKNWWNNKLKPWWNDKVVDNFHSETRDNGEGLGRFLNGVDNFWNRITGSGLTNAEREANKYSAAQAEEQYNREVEFYEKYQSPLAMMRQGVNPFSINGSTGGHTASGGSPSSVAPQGAEGLSGLMGLVQSIFGMAQQKRLNDSEIALNKSAVRRNDAESTEREINADTLRDMNVAEIMEKLSNIELNNSNIEHIASKILNTDADTDLKASQLAQVAAEIANTDVDTEVKRTQVSALLAQIAKDSKSLDVMKAQVALMATQAGVNRNESAFILQQIDNLHQDYEFNEILKGFEIMAAKRELGDDNFYNSKVLPSIKRTVDSLLGWWSGSSTIDLPQRKPSRIGYK